MSRGELRPLDAQMLRYCRAALGKAAPARIELREPTGRKVVVWRTLTNLHVYKMIRIIPFFLELRVRRLKWMQSIARDIVNQEQLPAAIFGQYGEDREPTVLPDGRLNRGIANPRALQWERDLAGLEVLESGGELSEEVENHSGGLRPLAPLLEEGPWQAFLAIDVSELRSHFLAAAEALPGFAAMGAEEDACEDERPHRCSLLAADGDERGVRFLTTRALAAHQIASKGGTHGQSDLPAQDDSD